jgi:hypothetical protein
MTFEAFDMSHTKTQRIISVLASPGFFWGVLGFFVLESLWIVFSAVYPMAFDEDFHFGVIKIYSHHWLPFLSGQPADANAFGSVARDPSYFYQYLMSFPYRLIELFTKDQTIQVICLRLINVGLFASALALFRKVLLRAKVSGAFTNSAMLLFALIPIVPLLAAEINYDNLTILLVAWVCLQMEHIIPAVQSKKIPLWEIGILAVVCLLGSIVKYAFLPAAAACGLLLIVVLWRNFRSSGSFVRTLQKSYRETGKAAKLILLILIVVSTGLFSQRYLVNLAAYKTPLPSCDKVLTPSDCMANGPFKRTHDLTQAKSTAFKPHMLSYIPKWFYGMWFRTFFAVNGNVPKPARARYQTVAPLPLPSITAIVAAVASVLVTLVYWRRLFKGDWLLSFFLLLAFLYCAALFVTNYGGYAESGQPVAVNGRYLLPMLLPMLAIVGRVWQLAFRRFPSVKAPLAGLVMLLFLQGGGVLTFILNSDATWYWPNHNVVTLNDAAKHAVQKFVPTHGPLHIKSP